MKYEQPNQSMIGKQNSNVVPMSLKMLKQINQQEYPSYFGHKVDLICLVAQVKSITPTISKRGLFQLSFILNDSGNCIIANYTQYEGQDITKSILDRNGIKSLKEMIGLVKCIIVASKDKNQYYDIKHIEKLKDHGYIMYHMVECIHYHCKIMYN